MSNAFFFVFIAFFSDFYIPRRLDSYLPRDVVEVVLHPFLLLVTI
jgi:hypothetical protein